MGGTLPNSHMLPSCERIALLLHGVCPPVLGPVRTTCAPHARTMMICPTRLGAVHPQQTTRVRSHSLRSFGSFSPRPPLVLRSFRLLYPLPSTHTHTHTHTYTHVVQENAELAARAEEAMNSTCPSRCHEDEGWGKCGSEVKDISLLLRFLSLYCVKLTLPTRWFDSHARSVYIRFVNAPPCTRPSLAPPPPPLLSLHSTHSPLALHSLLPPLPRAHLFHLLSYSPTLSPPLSPSLPLSPVLFSLPTLVPFVPGQVRLRGAAPR